MNEEFQHKAIINPTKLDELRQLDDGISEVLNKIIDMFLTAGPAHLMKMKEGLALKDLKILLHEAHNLKSSSANLGAERISWLAQMIEDATYGGQTADAKLLIHYLDQELQTALAALESEKKIPRG